MAKRQQTQWIWEHECANGTWMRVGWIHNKQKGVLADKIRMQIKSLHGWFDIGLQVWEAASLAAGLSKVICTQAMKDRIVVVPED